jgi:hypothetical protein
VSERAALLVPILVAAAACSGARTGNSDGGLAGTAGGKADGAGAGGAAMAASGPRVSDFIGLNGFIDDPTDKLAAVGNVREYHDWTWNDGNDAAGYAGYPNNQLSFSLFSGSRDFDAYYGALDQAGVMVFSCIEGSVGYLNQAMPPVPSGADVTLPASYAAHASFLYQLAARYGAHAVPIGNLKLATDQTVKTGTGLLTTTRTATSPTRPG